MNDKMKNGSEESNQDRRNFIKKVSATAVVSGLGLSQSAVSAEKKPADKIVNVSASNDLHICRGLNTVTETFDNKSYGPGTAPATNIPAKDLHGCQGGNTCKGLGGCGTGDYATQYWVGENNCGRNPNTSDWDGTGGCGVPLGSTNSGFICSQLNNAVPVDAKMPMDYIGVPVWAIARARFEEKMCAAQKAFDVPEVGCDHYKGNAWKPGEKYDPGNLPTPSFSHQPTKAPGLYPKKTTK